MEAQITEWISLILRWAHVIAGITWIGHALFFNWLDIRLRPPAEPHPDVEGELWMVHSGGFYRVEKTGVTPSRIPPDLHWFKWEAAFTSISGFLLLSVVYYLGGGALLVDPATSRIGPTAATVVGIGLLVVGWLVYDALWTSRLAAAEGVLRMVCLLLLAAVAWGASHVLSPRAAYIHVGALLGTLMAANVWVRIIPAQVALVEATRRGQSPEALLARRAKQRSQHNNYMTYPVIFIMVSNHYPSTTYGHDLHWVVLMLLVLAGGAVRTMMNRGVGVAAAATVAVCAGALVVLTVLPHRQPPGVEATAAVPSGGRSPSVRETPRPPRVIDPALAGVIHGVVRLEGPPPAPREVTLTSECHDEHRPSVKIDSVLVKDGMLQNAFVSIAGGLDGWEGKPPEAEVIVDQKGCLYVPRVLGARVGQRVTFLNSDAFLHNVRAVADTNGSFNLAMPSKGMRVTRTFEAPEVMVKLKCDVHPWMGAFIGVKPHPFFAVSRPDGTFEITGVPPGRHVVEAWHESSGRLTREVDLPARGRVEAHFTFKAE